MLRNFIDEQRLKHLKSSPLIDFDPPGFSIKDDNQRSSLYRGYNCDLGYDANLISGQYYFVRIFFNIDSYSKKELDKHLDQLQSMTDKEYSIWTYNSVSLFFPFVFKRPSFETIKSNLDDIVELLTHNSLATTTMEEANEKMLRLQA